MNDLAPDDTAADPAIDTRVPVTILTGFLGSGKTTLLNHLLTANHGKRIAVIENEYGEIGIDHELVVNAEEEIFEMSNGCICCTVRGDLIRVLGNLMRRRDRFDHILIETTGLADPGPVAQTFFVDDDVASMSRLDAIVTLVDAYHAHEQLDRSAEATAQIAFADVVVLNKIDLVDESALASVEARIRAINASTGIVRARDASVTTDAVLGIGAFDLSRARTVDAAFLDREYPFEAIALYRLDGPEVRIALRPGPDPSICLALVPVPDEAADPVGFVRDAADGLFPYRLAWDGDPVAADGSARIVAPVVPVDVPFRLAHPGRYAVVTEHLPEEFALELRDGETLRSPETVAHLKPAHEHDRSVGSVGLVADRPLDGEKFDAWLHDLVRERGVDVFRMKGVLDVAGQERRWVFHGVHMLVRAGVDRAWRPDEPRRSTVVLIGRDLDRDALARGFAACRA